MARKIRIGYLYGSLMNLYGDRGNVLALVRRAGWRDIEAEVVPVNIGDKIKTKDFDLFFFGGGQDQAQDLVSEDLLNGTGEVIRQEVSRGVPLLSICGGYQLLGKYYQPKHGPRIPGVGLFDAYTVSSDERMVGNLVLNINPEFQGQLGEPATLVGFENHSGKTFIGPGVKPLGNVVVGKGNNGEDKLEGAIYRHAIGCYLHGSLLPKNPHLADWLLSKALQASGQDSYLGKLRDDFELAAHHQAIARAKQLS